MSFLNTNNNNSSLPIENGTNLILGNPFIDDGEGDGFLGTSGKIATMPAPVVLSVPPPVVLTVADDEPPAANGDAPEPSKPADKEASVEIDGVSVVRTRVGLFEQLSNFVFADGVKTGKAKKSAPSANQDETKVEEKQLALSAGSAERPEKDQCDGANCEVAQSSEDPWARETRCSRTSEGTWPELQIDMATESSEGLIDVQKVKNFWRSVESESDAEETASCADGSEADDDDEISAVDLAAMNCNNNNVDPESRFKDFIDGSSGFHAYQPSAIAAAAERPSPYSRYIPPASKCRIGGGLPGAPAATEGGRLSKVPANKAGIPWGAKKQRLPPKQKFINQEPYQTLRPSGRWTHGTQMQQPANKQATADRTDPFPRYIAKKQKCKARPEFRKKTTDQGIGSSAKATKRQRRKTPINLDAVRCKCPGLYPEHPSHGPGNYWDEEDDDEAILAEMCPGDDLQECGQGMDSLFPLEEWSDEWEDGVLSGDCTKGGKLAPGTLELLPHENPCLEELLKRKVRVQELRNKRWANLEKARAEARKLKEEAGEDEETAALAKGKDLEREVLNKHGQKGWSLLAWFTPTKWASGSGGDCAQTNRPGKTCTTRTSTGPNTCTPANKSKNNNSDDVENEESPVESSPIIVEHHPEEMVNYEWDQADESDEDYNRRMTKARTIQKIEETKRRLHRMRAIELQRLQAERETEALEEKRGKAPERRSGLFSSVFGFFGSNDNNNTLQDDDLSAGNENNNAANRCFRPCPPCPQENCPPPPFECPCNDIHCPKKLKANKENVQKNKGCEGLGAEVGNVNVCIDVTEDLEIEGIDISVKKPPPDLSLGCPCGDEECKKKICGPAPPKKYDICELRNGKMGLQEACPVQECERDICDKDDDEPKECPCTDDNCPKKTGAQEGFVFLYPPTEKIKYDDDGCPLQQQMHCVVTQIGDKPPSVAVKPVANKSLHCELVPPCPCPEYEALENGSCLCSGNAWGEEIDDEGSADCGQPPKAESKDCGGSTAEEGVTGDDFEWDFWDSPCDDDVGDNEPNSEEAKKCKEFMEARKGGTDNRAQAIEAALEAFEHEKLRKERMKTEAATRKRRVEELRELGMSEDEIVDQLCSDRVPGPCEIGGEFPPQESCAPNPPPPGCPCPDAACPKRAPFDYQMHDTDLAKIKNPYDYKNTEKYLKSESYKTMDCELRRPTYKDVSKTYPKRRKNKCPCPECVTDTQKAWAEVEKAKIGPPPECPCKDLKCPKKPKKDDKEEEQKEDLGPCAMKTYYPKQSGCLEVVRCDLIRDVCGPSECSPRIDPEPRYKCHACSLRHPMPKQAACPDYDCHECKLVCHKCGCPPTKCDKCEAEDRLKEKPKADIEECPPCTVKGPLPKQTGCKEIHPCDEKHPCMCDPNTGEPIDAERCGPFDTRYHEFYPPQTGCDTAKGEKDCPAPVAPKMSLFDAGSTNMTKNSSIISEDTLDIQTNENNESTTEEIPTAMEEQGASDEAGPSPVNTIIAIDTETVSAVETDSDAGAALDVTIKAPEPTDLNVDVLDREVATLQQTMAESVSSIVPHEVDIIENKESCPSVTDPVVHDGPIMEVPETDNNEVFPEKAAEMEREVEEDKPIEAPEEVTEVKQPEIEEVGQKAEIGSSEEFIDLKKGTTANVKVEFRVVGLELSDAELKQVDEAFARQEAAEAAARKEVLEEQLKKAALEAVREKMKKSAPRPVEEEQDTCESTSNPEPGNKGTEFNGDPMGMDAQCENSCSFLGMEISAFVPAFMRPKAKCCPQKQENLATKAVARLKKEATNGLNVIDDLEARDAAQPKGIIHRASSMKIANRDKTAIGTRWMSKRRDLVFVNNDDGAIGLINFNRLSKENKESINRAFNVSALHDSEMK